ncbi:hypothetical protein PR048_007609 [Dryococelus australis]|uniref:C2H2-type domain-containing protein n=1 Tax=Dryococelus australis TaxID=614101 RepID=A0ABQ9HUQ4_9NEOP|nr:hypothetical protein PR048_007609 [Dryococelus australis]
MNVPQYGDGGPQQQQFQDALLQQYGQKAESHNVDIATSHGLVVVGNDGVRYHCTTSQNQHFNTQPNNSSSKPAGANTSVANGNTCQQNAYANTNPSESGHMSQCYGLTSNAPPRKADASTMTEKEIQTGGEQLFNSCSHQDKMLQQTYAVQAMVPTPAGWQSLAGPPGSTVAEYLSRLPASTLPITLHHFLKFSASSENVAPTIKKEEGVPKKPKKKRKYKKKPYIPRPPRPRPGEIRLTTALDGSTLYCCPECHMAYPEKELLEQHLVVHKLERRFVCDICGAALKRKEHLDRHKQGHNPDRPYVCTVCLKAFKRNEHLSRHVIIHSGDKNQVCMECGKGFYRKDHLRKHAQSHIAKRLRAELVAQKGSGSGSLSQSIVSLESVVKMGHGGPPPGVTAIALMPGGATLPILS